MIYSWRLEIEAVQGASHPPDLSAEEVFHALKHLSSLTSVWLTLAWEDNDDFSQGVIKVFSLVVRLGRILIRRHEDALLRSIYDRVPLKHEPADYNSPYFKIFLLLQAHFSRLPLSQELATDLDIVLERVFSLFSVCARHDWSTSDACLDNWPFEMFLLMQMSVHGMWAEDSPLKQIPHFDNDVGCSIKRQGLELIHASGPLPFPCGKHLLRARRRQHGCASTQRPPEDGRSEDVRQRAI
jgi:hypothetical protein